MKKINQIKWTAAAAVILLFTSCNESKNKSVVVEERSTEATAAVLQIVSSATFTVNNKHYTCVEVSAVADKQGNTVVISGRSGAEGETVFFLLL